MSQYLAILEVIRTRYCQEQNRLLPCIMPGVRGGEVAQVYSEQVTSGGRACHRCCTVPVMFVMLITDQSFLSVTVNNGRMLQVTGHM